VSILWASSFDRGWISPQVQRNGGGRLRREVNPRKHAPTTCQSPAGRRLDDAPIRCTQTPTLTMVWPFGPSASFRTIVSGKRAQRDDAIKAEVAALQVDDRLTSEEVAIVSKSGKLLFWKLVSPTNNRIAARVGDRQVHTGPGVYFDPNPQGIHQVCGHCPWRNQLHH